MGEKLLVGVGWGLRVTGGWDFVIRDRRAERREGLKTLPYSGADDLAACVRAGGLIVANTWAVGCRPERPALHTARNYGRSVRRNSWRMRCWGWSSGANSTPTPFSFTSRTVHWTSNVSEGSSTLRWIFWPIVNAWRVRTKRPPVPITETLPSNFGSRPLQCEKLMFG